MPATSSRLYIVNGKDSLDEVRNSLHNARLVDTQEIGDETYNLQSVVENIHWNDVRNSALNGTMRYESLHGYTQIDGAMRYVPEVHSADFTFFFGEIRLYLVVFSNMYVSETVAHKIDRVFNLNAGVPHPLVFNNFISTRGIEQFLQNHPHTIKDCGWVDLDFIGVNKSRLGGGNVYQFQHSQEYDQHGRKSFVLLELNDNGWVIRLSEEGIVTFYTNIPRDVALNFIRDEIVTLPN